MKQEPPFAIQIELVEGCNLFCTFCGIRGIRNKPGDYIEMSHRTAARIACKIKDTGWNSRIEFAMHGEPTMHPRFQAMIQTFRDKLPKNQFAILTNGGGLAKDPNYLIGTLFSAGINIVAIDDYKTNPFSKKIRKELKEKSNGEKFMIYNYPQDDMSPHSRINVNRHVVIFVEDITHAKSGGHSVLNSHCGCASPPPLAPINKRCAKPFRELSIRHDGQIAICCNDWRGHYACGSVLKNSLEVIWNNRAFQSARRLLYQGDRNFIPCKWCDAVSYRTGLLPDKMGKQEMEPPKPSDYKIVRKKGTNKVLVSNVVLRPWEINRPKTITDFVK